MKKFAVAIAVEGEDIVLKIVEATSREDAAFRACDQEGHFDDCTDEDGDNPRPQDLSDLRDFLDGINGAVAVEPCE